MQLLINGNSVDANLDDSLFRAIIISLFSWQRASNGDIYDGTNKMGWWGDTSSDHIGSKLWQYQRRTITADLMAEIENCARDALQWLIDDGVVSSFDLELERQGVNQINLTVTLNNNSYEFKDLLNG